MIQPTIERLEEQMGADDADYQFFPLLAVSDRWSQQCLARRGTRDSVEDCRQ